MATLHWIDYTIMVVYMVFVLGIGLVLKRFMKTEHRLLPLRPLDPGLDHRAGVHLGQPRGARR